MDLMEEIRDAGGYSSEFITLEVGSRGPVHPTGFDRLRDYLGAPTKEWDTKFLNMTKTVIIESHRIWTIRNCRDPDNE